jgi:hypothetical protein
MTEMNNGPKALRMSELVGFYGRTEHKDERNTNRSNGPCPIRGHLKR